MTPAYQHHGRTSWQLVQPKTHFHLDQPLLWNLCPDTTFPAHIYPGHDNPFAWFLTPVPGMTMLQLLPLASFDFDDIFTTFQPYSLSSAPAFVYLPSVQILKRGYLWYNTTNTNSCFACIRSPQHTCALKRQYLNLVPCHMKHTKNISGKQNQVPASPY